MGTKHIGCFKLHGKKLTTFMAQMGNRFLQINKNRKMSQFMFQICKDTEVEV
jgi:hypothetical protein